MSRSRKTKGADIHGILLLDKPLNISSNRALQRARAIFNAKKAGHTGSLDPLASGVLPICFGEATKVSSYLLDASKRYHTTLQLGETRDTGDLEGKVIATHPVPSLTKEEIEKILNHFRGYISQTPPMYSALKYNGQPLYELARKGIEVERPVRQVNIHELILTDITPHSLSLAVHCSKGTYIRTLAEDIGNMIGCGAHLTYLRRTEVEPFIDHTIYTLEELENLRDNHSLDSTLLSVDSALAHIPSIEVNAEQSSKLLHGQKLPWICTDQSAVRLYTSEQQFIGIAITEPDKQLLSPKRIFNFN